MITSNQGYGFVFQLRDGISGRECCLLPCWNSLLSAVSQR